MLGSIASAFFFKFKSTSQRTFTGTLVPKNLARQPAPSPSNIKKTFSKRSTMAKPGRFVSPRNLFVQNKVNIHICRNLNTLKRNYQYKIPRNELNRSKKRPKSSRRHRRERRDLVDCDSHTSYLNNPKSKSYLLLSYPPKAHLSIQDSRN